VVEGRSKVLRCWSFAMQCVVVCNGKERSGLERTKRQETTKNTCVKEMGGRVIWPFSMCWVSEERGWG